MPGLPAPLQPESPVRLVSVEPIPVARTFGPKSITVTLRLGHEEHVTDAYLIDSSGGARPMRVDGNRLIYERTDLLSVGPARVEFQTWTRNTRRSQSINPRIEFEIVVEQPYGVSGGPRMVAGPLRTKDELFRTRGRLTIFKPVVLRQRAGFQVIPTYPYAARFAGEMQASRFISFAFAAQRPPASHYAGLLREEDDLVALGLFDL